jgi:hypothetical protein
MRIALLPTLLTFTVLLTACSDFDQPPTGQKIESKETSPDDHPLEEAVPSTDATLDPAPAELPETPADLLDPTSANSNNETEAATERVVAEAGVGIQGQSLESGSMITQPAKTYFSAKQNIVFIQVEQALQLYKASTDSVPQSTEEFMEKVIQPNSIKLPELPRGHEYVFDAESGKLMVEKPK